MPAALTSTSTSPAPGTGRGTSRTSRTLMLPYESNCTALVMKHAPILRLRPRLKVVEDDIGELTAERGAIHCKTDAIEPFVHPDGILAHALADDIERNLVVAKGAAGDTREDGEGVIPRELVAREVEALAREATGVLKGANRERANVRDRNLR